MINPLEKMKAGIETNDMDLVRVGFEELTGQVTTSPKESPTPVKLEEASPKKDDFSDFIVSPQSSGAKSRVAKTEPVVGGQNNTFVDEGIEAKDIETPQITPSPRNRPPSQMVELSCHKCGKTEKVASNLVQGEFHRCGKCIRR
jgi:hypothetical protein